MLRCVKTFDRSVYSIVLWPGCLHRPQADPWQKAAFFRNKDYANQLFNSIF